MKRQEIKITIDRGRAVREMARERLGVVRARRVEIPKPLRKSKHKERLLEQ